MKKEEALNKAKKVLKDFNRDNYLSSSIKVYNSKDNPKQISRVFQYETWEVIVLVPDEQWLGAESQFSIYFDDESMEPFAFFDAGAPGRVPYLEILNKEGKYIVGGIFEEE